MTPAATLKPAAPPKIAKTIVVATLMGLGIAALGTGAWIVLAQMNATEHPELPWAAATQACWLLLLLLWLSGVGPPRSGSAFRRFHLRLWRPSPGAGSPGNLATILGLVCAHVGLTVLWIVLQSGRPPADLSAYPTTAFRFSALIMGAVVSGVVEEAAFRGYMQSHLERIGPTFAILVTSAVFTLLHATHGLTYLIAVAPGFFLVSVIYGYLALKTGSIIPGMILHAVGDAVVPFFVLLGGNAALLFVN